MIRKRNNKALYESIMRDVAKKVKKQLNESGNYHLYPEDYEFNNGKDVLYAILDIANNTDLFYYIAKACYFHDCDFNSSDPDLLKYFSEKLDYYINVVMDKYADAFAEELVELEEKAYTDFYNWLYDLIDENEIEFNNEKDFYQFVDEHIDKYNIDINDIAKYSSNHDGNEVLRTWYKKYYEEEI